MNSGTGIQVLFTIKDFQHRDCYFDHTIDLVTNSNIITAKIAHDL
jgi:hypothetical protein